jgi:hypothetical protein
VTATFNSSNDPFYLSLKKTAALAYYDYIHAYIIKNGQIKNLKTGRLVNVQDRADARYKFSLPLEVNKNDTAVIYFNVRQLNKPYMAFEPQLIQNSVLKNDYYQLAKHTKSKYGYQLSNS